eukprot:CAMPEP_0178959522 /NCGR_PEP_ID=MMETSP0789-20121207/12353_1 /TAXON_ID=3005 /ORGANISM="Rhizosolenia setigera, Strain CCMP 1694" /LENGTH=61 /DNA_ID=CAMNT_0020642565 /DNA_START=303 /DNA_END=485 /DNA_ORIENTATION=+
MKNETKTKIPLIAAFVDEGATDVFLMEVLAAVDFLNVGSVWLLDVVSGISNVVVGLRFRTG